MVTRFKAWAALFGTILTALLASGVIPVDGQLQNVLTVLAVIATAVVTYEVPYVRRNVVVTRNVRDEAL